MDRETYLYELSKELAVLPRIEAKQAIQYYQEYFDDCIENGKSEFEVITSLGTPSSVAAQIIAASNIKDAHQRVLEETANPQTYTQTYPKTNSKTALLAVFSPMILVAYILGFVLAVVGYSLLVSFGAVAGISIIGGAAGLLGSIPAAIYFGTWILMAELISAGLILIGLGLLFYLLTLKTYKVMKDMRKKISSLISRSKQK